jgi:hypothetical protein
MGKNKAFNKKKGPRTGPRREIILSPEQNKELFKAFAAIFLGNAILSNLENGKDFTVEISTSESTPPPTPPGDGE